MRSRDGFRPAAVLAVLVPEATKDKLVAWREQDLAFGLGL